MHSVILWTVVGCSLALAAVGTVMSGLNRVAGRSLLAVTGIAELTAVVQSVVAGIELSRGHQVMSAATFVGYLLAGTPGALVATAGIFAPAFAFVAASGPLLPRLRASRVAGAFLDGVNVASLALMAAVSLRLGRSAIVDLPTAVLGALALAALWRYRVNSAWLVLGGAVASWAMSRWAAGS